MIITMQYRISQGEFVRKEFKEMLPSKSEKYLKTVVAFSNSAGGEIIIGVRDATHEIVGVNEKEVFQIMDAIVQAISDSIVPQVFPTVTFKTVATKCLVIIDVFPGYNRPYYLKKMGNHEGIYIRVGATTRPADEATRKELELQGLRRSYDSEIYLGKEIELADIELLCKKIADYREKADEIKNERKVTIYNLEQWNIIKRQNNQFLPTNCFMLLTENPFNFAKIQCGVFKGIDRSIFVDKREYTGPIFEQIEEAYQFVLRNIQLGGVIEGIVRKDRYELPVDSIREAIVNAVVHRTYIERSCIQVALFDDRLEITSPGKLYGGITQEMILKGRSSIRNESIATIFSQMNIIEGWGTGIQRIFKQCQDWELPKPSIEELGTCFRLIIYRKKEKRLIQEETIAYEYELRAEVFLDRRMEKIKEIIQTEGGITRERVEQLFGLSKSGALYFINTLIATGHIYKVGRSRNSLYKEAQQKK